jgi:ABC-type multidrug transport system fused ATPase/permease subunit
MARSTSDITAVRSLVGFGAISIVSTSFAFVGVLAAMLAVDPWLTLWALAPYPALLLLARRFNLKVNERTEAAQDQLSVLSARVQEYLSGMAVVRAYTLEPRARADFGRANTEYLRLSLRAGADGGRVLAAHGLDRRSGHAGGDLGGRPRRRGRAAEPRRTRRVQRLSRLPHVADDGARLDALDRAPRSDVDDALGGNYWGGTC